MGIKPKSKNLNIYMQELGLKRAFPDSKTKISSIGLIWEADIKPSPLSRMYRVRLVYKYGKRPRVNVINPKLVIPQGKSLPHVYLKEELCLYYSKYQDWTPNKALGVYIVPWISEWLFNYEIWLITGKWCGGGVHPEI